MQPEREKKKKTKQKKRRHSSRVEKGVDDSGRDRQSKEEQCDIRGDKAHALTCSRRSRRSPEFQDRWSVERYASDEAFAATSPLEASPFP